MKLTESAVIAFKCGDKFKLAMRINAAKDGISISQKTRKLWESELNKKSDK